MAAFRYLRDPVADADSEAAQLSEPAKPLGPLGAPFDRRSPFFVGIALAAGMAVTAGCVWLLYVTSGTLVLIGVSLFLAVGLEPVVGWLAGKRLPRPLAVASVLVLALAVVAGLLAALIPPLVEQATTFADKAPQLLQQLGAHTGGLGERFQLRQRAEAALRNPELLTGLIGGGKALLGTLADTVIVFVLTAYFLANFPRLRTTAYRFVPHSRRPRAILIGDEILAKVGWYVLGNLAVSLIASVTAFVWLLAFGVPYPVLLALLFGVLDLIPVAGSTVGSAVLALMALTVSVPACLATVGFAVAYRVVEDYVLVPKIIGRVVRVPALVTVVAVLLGGVLLGVVGALVAIPLAAAVLLLLREVTFPRLDRA
ncbi:putative PurR-regulated permease PerM [Amycolatopsis bartoniae]|uniref:AI-2E family transporter n=1 Tax=Amycolatopsis bartoniae TaxID=941986 RepID=A0A8H9MC34_9PSEU|nr:AI-2E family transporter [Amycolatopsis bartoniae]MBB2933523.1 putative PurR-regulated permease PerM [Amycolatopsis bartoniae]TVT07620.1 AI-2E family transporter [Amycolatopsis bartoniae]GHF60080.1 AI-2E family transporter [Amycolatopsis bartoniae]